MITHVKILWKESPTRKEYWSDRYHFRPGDTGVIPLEDALFLKKHFPDNIELDIEEKIKTTNITVQDILSSRGEKAIEKAKLITDKHTLASILNKETREEVLKAVKNQMRLLIERGKMK